MLAVELIKVAAYRKAVWKGNFGLPIKVANPPKQIPNSCSANSYSFRINLN